jgi:Zn-dependent membrane protease YugP
MGDVGIEGAPGKLSDHYDPRARMLRLSGDVANGRSVASLAIVAHEIGHAEQDSTNYMPLKLRSAIVPAAPSGRGWGRRCSSGLSAAHYAAHTGLIALPRLRCSRW